MNENIKHLNNQEIEVKMTPGKYFFLKKKYLSIKKRNTMSFRQLKRKFSKIIEEDNMPVVESYIQHFKQLYG